MTGTELVHRNTMDSKIAYARHLAHSGLLPEQYRQQPANVLWAVEYGEMLGLSSMAAITGVHVIEGKPTASAGLISALVRRAGHQLRVTGNRESATCQIVRCDDPGFTFEVTWTLRPNGDGNPSAVDAGLCEIRDGKPWARSSKGKPLAWETYPASMLKSRAITQCARDACEEALFGLHYTPEEAGAEVDEDGRVVGGTVEPFPPVNGTPAAATDAADVVDAEVIEQGAAADAVDGQVAAEHAAAELDQAVRAGQRPISGAQARMIQASMSKLFTRDERDQRIDAIRRLIGRDITTTNDLTFDEAQDLLGKLKPVTSRSDLLVLMNSEAGDPS